MTRRFSKLVVACTLPGSIYAVACSSSSGTTTGKHPDAAIDAPADARGSGSGSGSCTASPSYAPSFGSGNSSATNFLPGFFGTGSPDVQELDGDLNTDPMPDVLSIELWPQAGGFGSGAIRTGTFQISAGSDGSDTSFATCGLCLDIETNLHHGSGSGGSGELVATDDYWATGGSVTLTSVGDGSGVGTLAGSISNVTFQHVMIAVNGTTTAVGDHCNSMIGSASFSATLSNATMMLAPGDQPTGRVRVRLTSPR